MRKPEALTRQTVHLLNSLLPHDGCECFLFPQTVLIFVKVDDDKFFSVAVGRARLAQQLNVFFS